MKSFFKYLLASTIGFFLSIFLLFLLLIIIAVSIAPSSQNEVISIKENSLLTIKFSEPIVDRTPVLGIFEELFLKQKKQYWIK